MSFFSSQRDALTETITEAKKIVQKMSKLRTSIKAAWHQNTLDDRSASANGSEHTATWNSQLGPKLESQYQAGNMNCGGQEKGTHPSKYCHKIMTLLIS